MSDDRDYWRRQDELRDERRREYLRDEYRREDELRADWEREDRQYEERQRDERHRQAMEEIRRGNTAWALNHIAGPDAAINYLRAMEGVERTQPAPDREADDESRWTPPHTFVTTIEQLLANVAAAPDGTELQASRIDSDGDAVVQLRTSWVAGPPLVASLLGTDSPPASGYFYVRAGLLADIADVSSVLQRAARLAAAIEQLADEA